MAQNVLPSDQPRENEVLGLVFWSVNFIRAVAIITFLSGVYQLAHVLALANAQISITPLAGLTSALGFIFLGVQTFQIFRFDKRYTTSEQDEYLTQALFRIGDIWPLLAFIAGSCVLQVIPYLILRATRYVIPTGALFALYGCAAFTVISLVLFHLLKQRRFSPPNGPIIREIPAFARRNINRTRFIGFFCLGAGSLLSLLYSLDLLPYGPKEPVETLVTGLAFIVVGGAITFYWRAVREIHRNPSLIYFERSLERLNLFWLLAAVAFAAQFIASVFA